MADFPPVGMDSGEDSRFFGVEYRDNTVSTEMEDGYEVSRPRSTRRPGRMFSSGFTDISDADKALLQTFWESVRGNADLFSWDDPTTGTEIMVRFKGTLKFQYAGIGGNHRWNVQFELKEV